MNLSTAGEAYSSQSPGREGTREFDFAPVDDYIRAFLGVDLAGILRSDETPVEGRAAGCMNGVLGLALKFDIVTEEPTRLHQEDTVSSRGMDDQASPLSEKVTVILEADRRVVRILRSQDGRRGVKVDSSGICNRQVVLLTTAPTRDLCSLKAEAYDTEIVRSQPSVSH